jgi:hypothetical protein
MDHGLVFGCRTCFPRTAARTERYSRGFTFKTGEAAGAGFDIDTVRRWLGQKTLAMAIHYSETADTTDRMAGVLARFDPLGKTRT